MGIPSSSYSFWFLQQFSEVSTPFLHSPRCCVCRSTWHCNPQEHSMKLPQGAFVISWPRLEPDLLLGQKIRLLLLKPCNFAKTMENAGSEKWTLEGCLRNSHVLLDLIKVVDAEVILKIECSAMFTAWVAMLPLKNVMSSWWSLGHWHPGAGALNTAFVLHYFSIFPPPSNHASVVLVTLADTSHLPKGTDINNPSTTSLQDIAMVRRFVWIPSGAEMDNSSIES